MAKGQRDWLRLGAKGEDGRFGELPVDLYLGSPDCSLKLLSLILLQTGLAEPVKCNFTVTESRVSSRSVSIQWKIWGSPCNFSLINSSDASEAAWCHPIRIDNTTYGCNPKDLQAGTIYNFRIVSLDGEERTVVLQTGKGWQVQLDGQATPDWALPFQAGVSFEFQEYKKIKL